MTQDLFWIDEVVLLAIDMPQLYICFWCPRHEEVDIIDAAIENHLLSCCGANRMHLVMFLITHQTWWFLMYLLQWLLHGDWSSTWFETQWVFKNCSSPQWVHCQRPKRYTSVTRHEYNPSHKHLWAQSTTCVKCTIIIPSSTHDFLYERDKRLRETLRMHHWCWKPNIDSDYNCWVVHVASSARLIHCSWLY